MPVGNLDEAVELFSTRFGFRLDMIFPADNPKRAMLSSGRLEVLLELSEEACSLESLAAEIAVSRSGDLEIPDRFRTHLNSTPVKYSHFHKPELIITRNDQATDWINGRAGMKYRDLIPGRLGGFLIASHIHVRDAGPVADYVHYHRVNFQLIFCVKGWARLVYEDQGDPFVFEAGDCVLQPPGIRHRVLETSGEFDVVEISSPAEHETHVEHEMELPNGVGDRERLFEKQRFVWSRASKAEWHTRQKCDFESRDLGITEASDGAVGTGVLRFLEGENGEVEMISTEVRFYFVLGGSVFFASESSNSELKTGDSVLVPSGTAFTFKGIADKPEVLEVRLESQ